MEKSQRNRKKAEQPHHGRKARSRKLQHPPEASANNARRPLLPTQLNRTPLEMQILLVRNFIVRTAGLVFSNKILSSFGLANATREFAMSDEDVIDLVDNPTPTRKNTDRQKKKRKRDEDSDEDVYEPDDNIGDDQSVEEQLSDDAYEEETAPPTPKRAKAAASSSVASPKASKAAKSKFGKVLKTLGKDDLVEMIMTLENRHPEMYDFAFSFVASKFWLPNFSMTIDNAIWSKRPARFAF
jgi:hypothetical protein